MKDLSGYPGDTIRTSADPIVVPCDFDTVPDAAFIASLRPVSGEFIRPKTLDSDMPSLCEITVAELKDGTILGIMRGFSGTVPVKYYSVSKDGGWTWSDPAPLLFDDGELLFSPASIPRLIRSTRNGKLYWIGNILRDKEELYPHDSSRPRNRLQIAEVDEDKPAIKRNTVAVIDDQKEGEVAREYSNSYVYEDRESGNLILTMCNMCEPFLDKEGPYPGSAPTIEQKTSHTYKYQIEL